MEVIIMNRIILSGALALLLGTLAPAYAGDPYEEGLQAALSGDYKTTFQKWKLLGLDNMGDTLFQLALMYHAGLDVNQNEAMAVQLYHSASEEGNHMAQEYLAAGYEYGWFGLPKSEELAAYYRKKSETSLENIASLDPRQ
jgi:TPR repeat protein